MPTNYGESRVTLGSYLVGEVRVTSVTAVPAIFPRIQFELSWTLGHLQRTDNTDPAKEYCLVGYGGELYLARNGPVVGVLRQQRTGHAIRSLPYVQGQSGSLALDLDWHRFEQLEEHRAGGALKLWVSLWPRVELDGATTDARIDGFQLSVPRDDWLGVVSSISGNETDLLEIRYHLSHAGRYRPSLDELTLARRAVDAGDFDGAVLQARKAVSLLEESVRSTTGSDLKSALGNRIDERHVTLYAGLISRAKNMGNIKAHAPQAREYTRAEALFAVRFATILIELVAAILAGAGE